MNSKLEEILSYPERVLRAFPGKLLFGPVSKRLFIECLDRKPGICGNIDFIHKINLDVLFEIRCSSNPDWVLAKTVWYPTRLTMDYEDDNIVFHESKLVTQNDIAYCVQRWENKSNKPIELSIVVNPSCPSEKRGDRFIISSDQEVHGLLINAVVGWNQSKDCCTLNPGASIDIIAAGAVGNQKSDPLSETELRLENFLKQNLSAEEYIKTGIESYEDFYKGFPEFDCNDPIINKTFVYRKYILRNSTSYPSYGFLQYPTVYEGRGHKTNKSVPFSTGGWEFSRLISLSSPLHMTDYRWFSDKELLHQFIRGYFSNLDDNDLLPSVFVNQKGGPFANYLIWAIYRFYLIDGDIEFVKEMLPLMKRNVDGNSKTFKSNNDSLMVEVKHQRTGKECQPSFWYFNDYPLFKWERKHSVAPLKRVDSSIYHYLNTLGLGLMMKAADDNNADEYLEKARVIANDMNTKSWDENSKFYYDIHNETDEKAMVKNIVGIYPYWADIADNNKLRGFEYIFDPEVFNTGCLFATTEKTNPAYSPIGAWKGFLMGRDSCMWNGPSWPYTNCIVLDAMGRQSRKNDHCYDNQFSKYLRDFSLQHYRYKDVQMPYLVEQYSATTGEDLSDEPDYNHSYYIDLIINYVVGLNPEEDKIIIDPIEIGLNRYELKNIFIRGHEIKIRYNIENGYSFYSDGKCLFENVTKFPFSVDYNQL